MIKEKFNLGWQMALIYISRAKSLLKARANISKEQAMQIAVNALLDNIGNAGKLSERNAAIRLWIDIFGINAPSQHRVGSPDGSPLPSAAIGPTVTFVLPQKNKKV